MISLALLGMPGTGKSHLALTLAERLQQMGSPAFVLHTDVLKVTLRHLGHEALKGPGYGGDLDAKARIVHPLLQTHAEKAAKEGYHLIVEGTLALGVQADVFLRVVLQLDDAIRQQRMQAKHPSARRALEQASHTDLERYRRRLDALRGPHVERLDASRTLSDLAEHLVQRLQAH